MANRRSFRSKEFKAWQQVWGMYAVMSHAAPILEERMKEVPNVWRDYRLCLKLIEKIYNMILTTVPIEDYDGIEAHLQNTKCEVVKVAPNPMFPPKQYTYVPIDALASLLKRVTYWECVTCTKTGKDCKKCPIRKEFNSMVPYVWEQCQDGCPYAIIDSEFLAERG